MDVKAYKSFILRLLSKFGGLLSENYVTKLNDF